MYSGKSTSNTTWDYTAEEEQKNTWWNNWNAQQSEASTKLGDFLIPEIGASAPAYEGNRVAGMSTNEQVAQGRLGEYVTSGTPQAFNLANTSLTKAINQDYDPIVKDEATQALYEQIKKQIMEKDLPELQNTWANNANLSGMYHSGPHVAEQRKLLQDTADTLAATLASLKYQDEQTRRDVARDREARSFEAIPQALEVGRVTNEDTLRKAVAGLEYGDLPRVLEQAKLDTDYEEFLRTMAVNNPALAAVLDWLKIAGEGGSQVNTDKETDSWSNSLTNSFSMGMSGFGG